MSTRVKPRTVPYRDQGLHLVSTTLVGQIRQLLETIGLMLAPHYNGPALPTPRVGRTGETYHDPSWFMPETGVDAPRLSQVRPLSDLKSGP